MRNKIAAFQQFMRGRYGFDKFSKHLLYSGLAVAIVFNFMQIPLASLLGWVAVIVSYYRVLSKQRTKRFQENQRYLTFINQSTRKWHKIRNKFHQRKQYKFYTCPNCKKELRVPRNKGKIKITCPRCHEQFIKKT